MTTITRISDGQRETMRSNALSVGDQGPTAEEQAYGPNGAGHLGYPLWALRRGLGDPQDPTAVSFPFLRRMRRDHMVSMGLHFISMPLIRAAWYYEADDARVASYCDHLIRPIYGSLMLTALRMLWAGYSPGARTFDTIQPQWVYYHDGESKMVWDNGPIGAIVYKSITPLRPEAARPTFDANGAFSGITYDKRYGAGTFVVDGRQTPTIDLLHSFWATHDKENEDGSIWGFPRIAHCAPIFHMFRWIWTLLGRAFENSADPGPTVRYPQDGASITRAGKTYSPVQRAMTIGTRKRSGSTIALPSDLHRGYDDKPTSTPLWGIEYQKPETDFGALMGFIGYMESAKLRALWLQEQGLIEGAGASSNRNVASEFGSQRDASQMVLMAQLDAFIDEIFVKPVIGMVFPTYQGELRKKTIGLGDDDNDLVRQALQLAGQQDFKSFGIDMRRLAESAGYPMLDPAEQQRQLEEAAKVANESKTPVVEPTQGRRALVTQTGFNEFSYHQLGGQVELADVALDATDDGDFVASLPRTDVFSDHLVLQEARKLRAASKSFLAWAYRDFAIYLSKQRGLEPAPEPEAEAGTDLLIGDGVDAAVARVMRGWRPRIERVVSYQTSVKRRLRASFDRVASNHAQKLGSKARASSADEDAARWLEDQGAKAVAGIMQTTREQLAQMLADGVRAGKTAKEIADDVRSHFETFPEHRAAAITRTELGEAYNFATVKAGAAAGVARAQLVDGNSDPQCRARNGRIVPLADAANERLNHTNCQLYVKLLANAPEGFSARREVLADGLEARYDQETETALISVDLDDESATQYMLALGDRLV